METYGGVTYKGPATLISRDETREYAVNACIRESRDIEWDSDSDATLYDIRRWRADIDGTMPDPPYGDCVLRLPDGREGRAAFADVRGTATTWEGQLQGAGPSPTAEPAKDQQWTSVFFRYQAEYEETHTSLEEALTFLYDGWCTAERSPKAIKGPDGQVVMDADAIAADRQARTAEKQEAR